MNNELTNLIELNPTSQEMEAEQQKVLDTASKLLIPTLTSLDSTQKNALGISNLVDHVEELSGHEQYVKVTDAIMNDPSLSIQEKLRLKRENDEWQDRRTARGADVVADLQDVNTKNNSTATNSWVGPLLIVFGVGACAFFGFTKPGRQLAGAAFKTAQHLAA